MARDDDTDDKKTSDKRRAGEAKPSAKPKENGGSSPKATESKKAEAGDDRAVRDKAKDKAKASDKSDRTDDTVKTKTKKAKEGKVREADVPAKPARAIADDHAHAIPHGHHAPNRKEYWKIFVVLFVLTVIEVAVAQIPGIGKTMLVIALVGLAVTKAACVAFFYMHLKHETRVLRYYVALPFAAPAVYALVLIAEAAWRLTR